MDGTGLDLSTLLAGVDTTMMIAIAVVSLFCRRLDVVPEAVEMVIPLVLGAAWGAITAIDAGAVTATGIAAGVYKGAVVNGAAAIVFVYVVDPLLQRAQAAVSGGRSRPDADLDSMRGLR